MPEGLFYCILRVCKNAKIIPWLLFEKYHLNWLYAQLICQYCIWYNQICDLDKYIYKLWRRFFYGKINEQKIFSWFLIWLLSLRNNLRRSAYIKRKYRDHKLYYVYRIFIVIMFVYIMFIHFFILLILNCSSFQITISTSDLYVLIFLYIFISFIDNETNYTCMK